MIDATAVVGIISAALKSGFLYSSLYFLTC